MRGACRNWWGDLVERDNLEDVGIDGKIILKWICKRYRKAGIGLIWLRLRTGDGRL
jgi:hypothetical protein